MWIEVHNNGARLSRYTYRCVVLPDPLKPFRLAIPPLVSMHLQVRGAP